MSVQMQCEAQSPRPQDDLAWMKFLLLCFFLVFCQVDLQKEIVIQKQSAH